MMVHKHAAARTVRKPRRSAAPVQVTQVDPDAMARARLIARGRDVHLVPQRDGTVVVKNGAR